MVNTLTDKIYLMWWQLKTQNLKILKIKNILVFIHSRQKYCIAFVVLSFLAICMQMQPRSYKKKKKKKKSVKVPTPEMS